MSLLSSISSSIGYLLSAERSYVSIEGLTGEHPFSSLYRADPGSYAAAKERLKEKCPFLYCIYEGFEKQMYLGAVPTPDQAQGLIQVILEQLLNSLTSSKRNEVYGRVYQLSSRPDTSDLRWGEHHAWDDIPTLIKAIELTAPIEKSLETIEIWRNETELKDKSRMYSLEDRVVPVNRAIGYINGVSTSFDQARADAYRFSDNLCHRYNIEGIWNASQPMLESLVASYKMMQGSVPESTTLLFHRWNHFFQHHPGENYLQICFSQGALITHCALKVLPRELRDRICVIAIAPAIFIPEGTAGKIMHFVKKEDIVPTALAKNSERLRNPKDPAIKILSHDSKSHPHDPHGYEYVEAIRPYVHRYLEHGTI